MDTITCYSPYLTWLDSQQSRAELLLETWANINSHSDNLHGLAILLAHLKKEFDHLSSSTQEHSLPPRPGVDAQGNHIQIPVGRLLSVHKRRQTPQSVLLGGHMDTVFPLNSPFQTCKKINANTLIGPGVADMKGGLLIMLLALEAFERSPFAEKLGWEVFINPDEETGSMSSAHYLKEAAKRHTIGLLFEPVMPDGAFVSSRKGSASYALVARGKSAHAGRDFHLGRNAITMLIPALEMMATLSNPLQGVIVNIGHIQGGVATNIVPDLAIARIGVRASTEEQMQTCIRTIQDIVSRMGQGLELTELSMREPKPFNNSLERLFVAVRASAQQLGISAQWKDSGGVCDGNILASAGLPNIDTLGAVGGNIHTDQEFIRLDHIVERAKLAALLLMKLADDKLFLSKE